MNKFKITKEFITLGQLLKVTSHIGSGGEAKFFLSENDVYLNGEQIKQRGKKIYPKDIINIKEDKYLIVNDKKSSS